MMAYHVSQASPAFEAWLRLANVLELALQHISSVVNSMPFCPTLEANAWPLAVHTMRA